MDRKFKLLYYSRIIIQINRDEQQQFGSNCQAVFIGLLHNNHEQQKQFDLFLQPAKLHGLQWLQVQRIKGNWVENRVLQFQQHPVPNSKPGCAGRTYSRQHAHLCKRHSVHG